MKDKGLPMRFVLTDVSSIKTTRSGLSAMAETRWVNQSARACFTRAFRLSSAMSDFFICKSQPAEHLINARDRGPHTMGVFQRSLQFFQGYIRVLCHQFGQKVLIRSQPSLTGLARIGLRREALSRPDLMRKTGSRGRRYQ